MYFLRTFLQSLSIVVASSFIFILLTCICQREFRISNPISRDYSSIIVECIKSNPLYSKQLYRILYHCHIQVNTVVEQENLHFHFHLLTKFGTVQNFERFAELRRKNLDRHSRKSNFCVSSSANRIANRSKN